jgi:hypothetical protein
MRCIVFSKRCILASVRVFMVFNACSTIGVIVIRSSWRTTLVVASMLEAMNVVWVWISCDSLDTVSIDYRLRANMCSICDLKSQRQLLESRTFSNSKTFWTLDRLNPLSICWDCLEMLERISSCSWVDDFYKFSTLVLTK